MIAALLDSVMPEAARQEDSSARDQISAGEWSHGQYSGHKGWPIKEARKKPNAPPERRFAYLAVSPFVSPPVDSFERSRDSGR
jgi:hypothetical protein